MLLDLAGLLKALSVLVSLCQVYPCQKMPAATPTRDVFRLLRYARSL